MRHGEHGFLVWSEQEMVDACRRVREIDRRCCRDWVLDRFSVERMADGYEHAYRQVQSRSLRTVFSEAEGAGIGKPRSDVDGRPVLGPPARKAGW